jgi:hypothetical protein
MVRFAFVFEPLAPRFITYYVSQRLKESKKKGVISEFKTKTRRLGKFHYKIEVDMDATQEQARHILEDILDQLRVLRR